MDLQKTIRERYSVRSFSEKYIPVPVISEILELAGLAPSAVNYQPWQFIVLTGRKKLETIWPVYHRPWIQTAPVIIVACIDHHQSWKRSTDGKDFGTVDVAIAVDHLTLAATAAGLGTCWVCNFDAVACKSVLGLPEHIEPLVLIPMGYPASERPVKKRKSLTEIISWEEFGNRMSDFSI